MKTKLRYLFVVLALLAGVHDASTQGTRFFRISGPAVTKIMAIRSDGTLVWTNALAGTNYTVQTVTSQPVGTNWVDYVQIPISNSVNTNLIIAFNPPAGMKLIPAGVFTMGDALDGEADAVPIRVTISAFYMDVNLVNYGQWQTVYGWATNHGYGFDNAGSGKAANNPAQWVDWYDCVKWSNARSQQAGLTPVYYTDAALTQVYTNGDVEPWVNWTNSGYRLPTEAEWEKAARGGLSGLRFPWGNWISETQANYYGETNSSWFYDLGPNGYNQIGRIGGTLPATSAVGSFAANGYGLNDMAGNVEEWCWDYYGTQYSGGVDPRGPGLDSSQRGYRVYRGGEWDQIAILCRSAWRQSEEPNFSYYNLGVRCVKGL
jgi:formylglycine-generating enzyme required for sulfatase activity